MLHFQHELTAWNLALIIAPQTDLQSIITQDQKFNVENKTYAASGHEQEPPCMAQPGLQPCLSPGSYTGTVKKWLDGTWTHVFPPHELLRN